MVPFGSDLSSSSFFSKRYILISPLSLSHLYLPACLLLKNLDTCHRFCVMVYAVSSLPIRWIRVVQAIRCSEISFQSS